MSNTSETRAAVAAADNSPAISEAQLAANRANAQLSTGPRTDEGKAKSALNAVKTGLTGRNMLLPTEDVAVYQQHIARIVKRYSPATDDERTLVQSIADTEWRLLRIAPLEQSFYALGRRKLLDQFTEEADPATRDALIQTEIFNLYRKEFNNLALQERRLRNHRKDDIAELEKLRSERKHEQETNTQTLYDQACVARRILSNAAKLNIKADLTEFGFEFSESEVTAFWKQVELQNRLAEGYAKADFEAFLHRVRATAQQKAAA